MVAGQSAEPVGDRRQRLFPADPLPARVVRAFWGRCAAGDDEAGRDGSPISGAALPFTHSAFPVGCDGSRSRVNVPSVTVARGPHRDTHSGQYVDTSVAAGASAIAPPFDSAGGAGAPDGRQRRYRDRRRKPRVCSSIAASGPARRGRGTGSRSRRRRQTASWPPHTGHEALRGRREGEPGARGRSGEPCRPLARCTP